MSARRRKSRKPARRSARKATRPKRKAASARRAARRKPKRASARKAARSKPKRASARKAARPRREAQARPPAGGRPAPARPPASAAPRGERLAAGVPVEVGVVVHWYPRASAAVVALSHPIHVGDTIHVRGHSTDFVQQVASLALEGAPVRDGAPPQALGVRLEAPARRGDRVYRVSW